MKSFEEWYDNYMNEQPNLDWHDPTQKECYEVGQHSKQDEVDLLQGQVDELQKRIDKLILLLERYDYSGWIEILKGNK